jgi:hypothetical protein
MKGLLVDIYKFPLGVCTNNGISGKVSKAVLTGYVMPQIFEPSDDAPELKIVQRKLFGKIYFHCEPINNPQGNGWMMGGNFVYTSDSRYHYLLDYPMPVHDRQEF